MSLATYDQVIGDDGLVCLGGWCTMQVRQQQHSANAPMISIWATIQQAKCDMCACVLLNRCCSSWSS